MTHAVHAESAVPEGRVEMRQNRLWQIVTVCAVMAFAYFVWPTPRRAGLALVETGHGFVQIDRVSRFPGPDGLAEVFFLGLCGMTLFAWLVWPTPWAHHPYTTAEGLRTVARVNRFTGQAVVLFEDGWRAMSKG